MWIDSTPPLAIAVDSRQYGITSDGEGQASRTDKVKMPSLMSSSTAIETAMKDYDKHGCLHDMFIAQAKRTPNATAVVTHDGNKVTYAELDEMTELLATRLRQLGVTRNTVVGILMDRCLEYVISYIAILRAGGAYLPLEISYPSTLLASVLEDAEPIAVCSKTPYLERLPSSLSLISLDQTWKQEIQELVKASPLPENPSVSLDDMAYTVYSSGTTGKPKGIQCPHRGAVFSYYWRHIAYPYKEDEREACNVFFVWEMLRPLIRGIELHIIPDDIIYDPPRLIQFLQEHKITRMMFTPSLLQAVLDFKGLQLDKAFESMRQLWFCGEVMTIILRDRFATLFPHIQLLNLYSVSECHDIACSDLTLDKPELSQPRKFCPVGKLLPGVQVVIMDEEMNVKPVGAPGEIYVGGPTLAIGYLNRPDLNAQRFIPRPEHVPPSVGDRLYRTGDWGYMLSDGNLEICGRCDSMVKIRGYSIEIQAVETALLDLPMVQAGCVLAQGEEGSDKFLVAYIVAKGKTSRKEVRAALKKRLPFYMIPSKFIFLSSIPILESSGKLDKKSLPKTTDLNEDHTIDPQDLPSTPMEHKIANIWCRVLKIKAIDVQENFFELGGHSLLATQLLSEMNQELGLELAILNLFQHPTVSSMAIFIENPSSTNGSDSVGLDLLAEVDRHHQGKALMDIRLRAFWRSFQLSNTKWRRDKVLLTGVTGYVGAFILKELLQTTKTTVYCLVRMMPGLAPMERIRQALMHFGIINSETDDLAQKLDWRVIPVNGDITLLNLGMSEDDYMYLSYEVDSIIHAAAKVNLIYPYRALHSTNVLGTENIINFALEHKIKPVHHISTDAVFPDGLLNCSEDANMSAYAGKLTSGYSQSKWVAEQLVLRARDRGLPVAIYRCGNVGGSQEEASWNPADFTLLMLQGCIATLKAPDINWQIELTPVDFVSRVIVGMSQDILHSIGKIFHLINTETMDCHHLWQLLRVQGYPVEVVPYTEWYRNVQEASQQETEYKGTVTSLLYLLDALVREPSYFSKMSTYTRNNLEISLEAQGLKYPPVDAELMRKYLRHLAQIGFIPRPNRRRRDTAQLLHSKVALVTGASSGIGAAIAEHLALAGAKVALAARRTERLKEIQTQIERQGGTAIIVTMDVVDVQQVQQGVQHIESMLGPVDILVNNAGVMYYTFMKNLCVDQWHKTVDVNVKGVLNATAAVLDQMVKNKQGHIVNITSDAGRRGFAGLAVYSGTKFFVEGMSQAMRQELVEYGIRVTCIQPGDVTTELAEYSTDAEAVEKCNMAGKMKFLEPTDIAQAVVYAVSQPEYCAVNEILVEPREAPI